MAQIISNIQPTMKSAGATLSAVRGVGTVNQAPVVGGLVQVAGAKDEVVRLSVNQIQNFVGQSQAIQSSVSVDVRYSLSNPALATHPVHYADATWTTTETIAPNVISKVNNDLPFVAVEITFSDNGIFCLYTR